MASYTKQDVIDTLTDPAALRVTMYVKGLWIGAPSFSVLRLKIIDGSVKVEEGSKTNAYYLGKENKIVTQMVSSSLEHARALLLHECTHAVMDVYRFKVPAITNEVLCYITQYSYLNNKIPGFNVIVDKSLDPTSQNALWDSFYKSVWDYARNLQGYVDITDWQFLSLRNHLRVLNIYQHLSEATMYDHDGV